MNETTPGRSATGGLSGRVAGKLLALRRALKLRLLAEGVCWLLLALAGLMLLTLALDYGLRLEKPQRAMVMALAVLAVVWTLWRHLIRPAAAPMAMVDLALLVEQRYPQLQARLVSAVQFDAQPAPPTVSRAMIDRTVAQANELAVDLAFKKVVERRQLNRTLRLAISAVGLIIGLAIWQGDLVRLWAARNLLFADVPWPQTTYLTVEGGPDFTVLRGEDLRVDVTVESSSPPASITVHARYPSVGWTEEQVPLTGRAADRYEVLFRQVAEPFEFYVTGGDDRRDKSRPHQVHLVDPPALREVRFLAEYPDYMDRQPTVLDGGAGILIAPVGGTLWIEGVATKDLQAARIGIYGEQLEIVEPLEIGGRGSEGDNPRRIRGRIALTAPNTPQSVTLRVHLTDAAGYENHRGGKYVLRLQPDVPPSVDCRKLHVGPAVTPYAMIPLAIRAEDDAGVASLTVLLFRAGADDPLTGEAVALTGRVTERRDLVARHELDLLDHGLNPGDRIALVAEGVDILPPQMGGPNRYRSGAVNLRIIRPEELMSELLARRKVIRTDFLQAQAQQQTAIAGVSSARSALDRDDGLAVAQGRLTAATGVQRAVHAEVVKVREKLLLIADEMTYNRLGDPGDVQELHARVIDPLARLDQAVAAVLGDLNDAGEMTDPTALDARADRIVAAQQDIDADMTAILEAMIRIESRQELANQLQVIVKWSEEILEEIRRREESEVGTIFGGGGDDDD
ncbi:MAG: hypothetical protein ACYTFO_03275 [Planctomycetota bacterium]|jgi:hypothetical protein